MIKKWAHAGLKGKSSWHEGVVNTLASSRLRLKSSSLHVSLRGKSLSTIAIKSCSNPQKIWQVFPFAMKIEFFGFRFFVSDIISRVVLGLFVQLHLVLAPNC